MCIDGGTVRHRGKQFKLNDRCDAKYKKKGKGATLQSFEKRRKSLLVLVNETLAERTASASEFLRGTFTM